MIGIVCVLMLGIFIYMFCAKKNYFNVVTYIFTGVFFPLALYLLGWSDYIIKERAIVFDYTFVVLAGITFFYCLATVKIKPREILGNEEVVITKAGTQFVPLINIVFILLYLAENYIICGMLMPALNGVDIHIQSVPIISFITNSQIVVIFADYFAWKATKKKSYLLSMIIVFSLPLVSRASRMMIVQNAVCFFSLFLFIEGAGVKKNIIKYLKFKKLRNRLILIGLIFGMCLMAYTNYRMNHFGVYNLSYSDEIRYSGPEWLEFLSPYYGYFPLSFNNLNISMLYSDVEHNYFGLYSFTSFFFGLLQLDNLMNIDVFRPVHEARYSSLAASVPTGFWEYYYDFGYLCFIPIIVALIICGFLLKNAAVEEDTLIYRAMYFMYIPLWFLMSFQNVLFMAVYIYTFIFMYFVIKHSFKIVKKSKD